MKSFVYFSIFAVLIFTLSTFSTQDAHAIGGTVDATTCVSTFGGTWNGVNQCTVSSLTIGSTDTLIIPDDVSLKNTGTLTNAGLITIQSTTSLVNIQNDGSIINSGTININDGGFINDGSITNSGLISITDVFINGAAGIIYNNLGGKIIINESGSITNYTYGIIYNYGAITIDVGGAFYNNSGTIKNTGIITNKDIFINGGTIKILKGGSMINSGQVTNCGKITGKIKNIDSGTIIQVIC